MPDPAESADPAELVTLATDLAHRAGAMLIEGLDGVRSSVETKSSSTDMVTEMDKASEALIVEGILARRPDDAILGEEGTERPGRSGVRWVIDPVDGTTNYLYRIAGFAVSIAAEQVAPDGTTTTVAGVVHDPVHGDTFAATLGGGATRNGRPVACSPEPDLQRSLVATGFSYIPDVRREQAAVLVGVLPRVRDIRRFGAAAVDLCSVACGRVDAYYEAGLAPWDLAAGALVAREAGALVSDLDGADPTGAFVVAAPPTLAGPLRDLLRECGAEPVGR